MDGVSDTHLIDFAPAGPTSYSGELRCDEAQAIPGADVNQKGDPCPPYTFSTTDPNPDRAAEQVNIFEGVEGVTADRPVWYYDASIYPPRFRCNLRCHGVVMSTCFYITDRDIAASATQMNPGSGWCAGGLGQVAPITFGALPPEVKDLMAKMEKENLAPGNLPGVLKQYVAGLEQAQEKGKATGEFVK
jgi:hypothetical protein